MGFHCPKSPNPARWGPGAGLRGAMGGYECPPGHMDTQTDGQAEPQVRQRCSAPRLQPQLPAIPPRVQHRLRLVGTRGWGHCSPALPPHPSPPFIFQPLPAAAGGWGEGTAGAAAPSPFVEVFGAFPCWFGVCFFFFLEGDFRTSPPNLGAAPCGLVLVPGAAGTPACPIPGGGCGGEGAKVLPCYTWMFWGGFGHFWVHPP